MTRDTIKALCLGLVIATGISFKKPQGDFNFKDTPHAWIAGPQTTLLAKKLNTIAEKGSFVMTIPKSPYRCPPGPYERACLVADFLKREKRGGTVTVLDANNDIQAEKHTFDKAFNDLYGGIIDYRTNVTVESVNSAAGVVETNKGDVQGDVVNVIPQQRALGFVRRAKLTGDGDWAGVDPLTYESTEPGFEGVHIIGDSQGSGQPKSAHMANAQAKVCADAIIRSLAGLPTKTQERMDNITTNSACYSPITYDEASWLTANFRYQPGVFEDELGQMVLARPLGEADHWSRENYKEMFAWASNLFTDSFH